MGKHAAPRQWWERLELDRKTAEQVAERGTETPAELAGMARAAPDAFRRVFGEGARAELARALTAHLATAKGDEGGYSDLLAALEELAGKRPAKPMNPPNLSFGALFPHPQVQVQPAAPLPKLGPNVPTLPPPKPVPGKRDGQN